MSYNYSFIQDLNIYIKYVYLDFKKEFIYVKILKKKVNEHFFIYFQVSRDYYMNKNIYMEDDLNLGDIKAHSNVKNSIYHNFTYIYLY